MAERFYFDTFDGRELLRDTEGLPMSDLARAWREAFRALADMAAEGVGEGQWRKLSITVRDREGLCFRMRDLDVAQKLLLEQFRFTPERSTALGQRAVALPDGELVSDLPGSRQLLRLTASGPP